MNRPLAALAGLMTFALTLPALADPTGTYAIDGTNPDGTRYEASVLVSRVGDTYAVTYTLDDATKVQGTAIGDNDVLAIGYGEEGDSGVALMVRAGRKWEGVWAYQGAKAMGTELWTPR